MAWFFSSSRGERSPVLTRAARGQQSPEPFDAGYDDGGEQPAAEPFRRKLWRWTRHVFVCLLCAGGCAAAAVSAQYIRHFLYQTEYFAVREVRITGAGPELTREAREWINDPLARAGNNLARVDRRMLDNGLATLPRAKQVRVHKVYPDTLQVSFIERQPLAAVNLGQLFFMDNERRLLAPASARDVARLELPIVTGLTDISAVPGCQVDSPRLAEVVDAIQFINTSDAMLKRELREWNLNGNNITALTRGGAEVRFGEESLLALLPKLSNGLEQRRELRQASLIDLRIDSQIVYRPEGTSQQ